MDRTPEAFAAALESGDTDRVNEAIDAVGETDAVDRAAIYDDCFDRCLDLYDEGDGYQCQSVVRFLRDAYPMVELKTVGGDEAVFDEVPKETVDAQRERFVEFLLAALEDDDGRVRKAAAKGVKSVATTMKVAEYDAELEALESLLEDLAENVPEAHRKHVEQARQYIVRQRGPFFSSR